MEGDVRVLNELVRGESAFVDQVVGEVRKVIVGQPYMVERILIGLLTGGHVLLEGVPGLAKTLTVKTLSDVIDTRFQRIQFTPDLLPADLIGTMIYHQASGEFSVKKGPIFSNLVLADEINRAPAKVQSALLEAMQEHQITIGETTYQLEEPFLVLATQNPIEQEGTYPLPEAQVDRFMLKIKVDYPSRDDEREIIDRMTGTSMGEPQKSISVEQLLKARDVVGQVYLDDRIKDYIVNLVFATRDPASAGAAAHDPVNLPRADLGGLRAGGGGPPAVVVGAAHPRGRAPVRRMNGHLQGEGAPGAGHG